MQYVDIGWEGAPYRERIGQMIVRGGDGRTQYPHKFAHAYVDTSRQHAPWGEHRLQGYGAISRQVMQAAKPAFMLTNTSRAGSGGMLSSIPWWTWVAVPLVLGAGALIAYDQGLFGK